MQFTSEKVYQVGLSLIPKIGDILIKQLVSYCGSAENVFKAPKPKLLKIPNIGEVLAQNIVQQKVLKLAESVVNQAEKENVHILFYLDANYPRRLKSLYDAPCILYYKGNAEVLNPQRSIAIVGTRQMTDYGRIVTEQIVAQLKTFNCVCVSGLAYGVDICAHKASVQHQIPTIGVMANGIDKVYPSQHKQTAMQMQQLGGVMSEHPFGIIPEAPYFPRRNRIIAGMSDATIVVEAAIKGGALITAEFANNYHRDVFAVPGQLGKSHSEGCNLLIRKNKAQIYTQVEDIVESLNWDLVQTNASLAKAIDFSGLSTEESQILALLHQKGPLQIDEISWQSQIVMARLASLLLYLEFQGLVKALPGKKFCLA